MTDRRLIPPSWRVLSGSALKMLAVVSMLVDHTASALLARSTAVLVRVGTHKLTLYRAMRIFGRLAFPLYCFLLLEGFIHTHDRKRYALRLGLFALVSELPWNLEHSGALRYAGQNVFFTLLFGFLGLCVLEWLQQHPEDLRHCAFALLALLGVSVVFKADYGCSGYGFILMLYLLRTEPLMQAVIGSCFLSSRWQAGLAFIPINLYNGQRGFIRGKFLQWLFYAIYPLHMLILYFIKRATIGW